MTESHPDPFVGSKFSGYRIEGLIGRGGMGSVYRAEQLSLARPVALKILPRALAEDPHFLERFHREAEVLSRLNHPNVVTVFDRGEVEGRPYLVLELVEGTSLREVLRQGPLPAAEALKIVSSVLSALEHAHSHGIVHRDVKPENILMTRGGTVKVADFGLSRLIGPVEHTRLTRTQLVLGTYEYMAPEQRERASEADARSDIYAVGVVLYEMLTGGLPIGHFQLPSAKRPGECDRRIDEILKRCLHKDPEERFQGADEVEQAVSLVLERPEPLDPPLAAPLEPPHYRPSRFEMKIDNIATVDHVLGTLCYVAAVITLFQWKHFGFPPWLVLFVVGWYLRNTAFELRRYKQTARTAQALIAFVCFPTLVLAPFSLYCLFALFSHRGRTYFAARSRGFDEAAAARYTYRVMEEPFEEARSAPLTENARAPHPDDIPVRSVVTSRVQPTPPVNRSPSPVLKLGLIALPVLGLGYLLLTLARVRVPHQGALILFGSAVALVLLGLLHSLVWPPRR